MHLAITCTLRVKDCSNTGRCTQLHKLDHEQHKRRRGRTSHARTGTSVLQPSRVSAQSSQLALSPTVVVPVYAEGEELE
eukprot:2504-Eustigmatos_ZCMA.PRE.1